MLLPAGMPPDKELLGGIAPGLPPVCDCGGGAAPEAKAEPEEDDEGGTELGGAANDEEAEADEVGKDEEVAEALWD